MFGKTEEQKIRDYVRECRGIVTDLTVFFLGEPDSKKVQGLFFSIYKQLKNSPSFKNKEISTLEALRERYTSNNLVKKSEAEPNNKAVIITDLKEEKATNNLDLAQLLDYLKNGYTVIAYDLDFTENPPSFERILTLLKLMQEYPNQFFCLRRNNGRLDPKESKNSIIQTVINDKDSRYNPKIKTNIGGDICSILNQLPSFAMSVNSQTFYGTDRNTIPHLPIENPCLANLFESNSELNDSTIQDYQVLGFEHYVFGSNLSNITTLTPQVEQDQSQTASATTTDSVIPPPPPPPGADKQPARRLSTAEEKSEQRPTTEQPVEKKPSTYKGAFGMTEENIEAARGGLTHIKKDEEPPKSSEESPEEPLSFDELRRKFNNSLPEGTTPPKKPYDLRKRPLELSKPSQQQKPPSLPQNESNHFSIDTEQTPFTQARKAVEGVLRQPGSEGTKPSPNNKQHFFTPPKSKVQQKLQQKRVDLFSQIAGILSIIETIELRLPESKLPKLKTELNKAVAFLKEKVSKTHIDDNDQSQDTVFQKAREHVIKEIFTNPLFDSFRKQLPEIMKNLHNEVQILLSGELKEDVRTNLIELQQLLAELPEEICPAEQTQSDTASPPNH